MRIRVLSGLLLAVVASAIGYRLSAIGQTQADSRQPTADSRQPTAPAASSPARAARFLGKESYAARATQAILALLDETVTDSTNPPSRHTALPSMVVNRL